MTGRLLGTFVLSLGLLSACTTQPKAQTQPPDATPPQEPAKANAPTPPQAPESHSSPRHQEWADVRSGDRVVHSFVAYPESSRRVPAIIVIHENRGLTDWVRTVADRVAEAGFVAIAPDLLSGTGPGGGGTDSFANEDAAIKGIYALPSERVTADLNAVAEYVRALPACDGRIACAGFCWGGSQTFRFATDRNDLVAAYVFYGAAPEDAEAAARIRCPVYGFYAENDARVNATLPSTKDRMSAAGKTFEPVTYAGAGHAFMRMGESANAEPANRRAHDDAWDRWLKLLRDL